MLRHFILHKIFEKPNHFKTHIQKVLLYKNENGNKQNSWSAHEDNGD